MGKYCKGAKTGKWMKLAIDKALARIDKIR